MGEKDHEKADTFVTLKCCTNVVSENNIFNVFLWFHFIDNWFASTGHVKEALLVRINSRKKEFNPESTQELKVENNLLYEEQQKGYHKCLQDGCTF